jgi:GH15 family glucan-1,4-alpha-glucosidase
MCWAAADRMRAVAARHRPRRRRRVSLAAARIRAEVLARAVDPARGCLVADYGGRELDASLLQAVTLGLLPADAPCLRATVDAVRDELGHRGWLKRYRAHDGLGEMSMAFTLCTFWLVEALARQGRDDEARATLARVRDVRAPLGLLAEDLDPDTGEMWGNFPQAYSHVGLIHAAFAVASTCRM